jgi:hypothetical protein
LHHLTSQISVELLTSLSPNSFVTQQALAYLCHMFEMLHVALREKNRAVLEHSPMIRCFFSSQNIKVILSPFIIYALPVYKIYISSHVSLFGRSIQMSLGLSYCFVVSKKNKRFEEFSKILHDTKLCYSISIAFNLTLNTLNKPS